MDRLDAMLLFVTAVREGSLAAAARHHGRSPAAVTRAVALLEQAAGETLLLRSTRNLSLTTAGERHLAVWQDVLTRLGEIAPTQPDMPLQGNVVLTSPELFGRLKVMPLVENFLRDHRHVAARLLMVNRVVNLAGEGVDLAVRLAPLPDSSLSAIRLGQVRSLLCASPAYLSQARTPTTLKDFDRHDCIGLNADGDAELWKFATDPGRDSRTRAIRVNTRLSVSNAAAAIDAALRGHGIIYARSYQVADSIAAGHLVRLLPDFETPAIPAHLVFSADRAKKGPVRALIDHLVPALRDELSAIEVRIAAASAVSPDRSA